MTRWLPLLVLCSVAALAVDSPSAEALTDVELPFDASVDQLAPTQEVEQLQLAPSVALPRAMAALGAGRAVVQDVFHPPIS